MQTELKKDRAMQVIGLILLTALTLLLLFAFRAKLLPSQEDGDVFGTVYVYKPESSATGETPENASEVSDSLREDLPD